MYIVSFHSIFNENAMILAQRLNITFVVDLVPKFGDIIIVFGAHEQADKLCLLQKSYSIDYIIMQTEQIESKVFDNKYYMELIQNNPIVDWSKSNVEKIKSKINAKVYGLYFYEFFGMEAQRIPTLESRPIDFFFSGAKSPERERMIQEFKQANPNAVFDIDYSYSHINPMTLTEKLLKVKYVLNLPFYKGNALETHRIHRALSLGCEVISLVSADDDMNRKYSPYIHFVSRLTEFTPLIEHEPRANFPRLLNEFGLREIENNVRGFLYAEKKIMEKRSKKNESGGLQNEVIEEVKIKEIPKPLRQPVSTDFSKFLSQKKLNEKQNSNTDKEKNVDSSV
jgi:hypothetical protein